MAIMQREEPKHGEAGRDYYQIVLDDQDLAALSAGHPVQIRVGLPLNRRAEDSTFTLFRRKA